jgi:hypothetical protein
MPLLLLAYSFSGFSPLGLAMFELHAKDALSGWTLS